MPSKYHLHELTPEEIDALKPGPVMDWFVAQAIYGPACKADDFSYWFIPNTSYTWGVSGEMPTVFWTPCTNPGAAMRVLEWIAKHGMLDEVSLQYSMPFNDWTVRVEIIQVMRETDEMPRNNKVIEVRGKTPAEAICRAALLVAAREGQT